MNFFFYLWLWSPCFAAPAEDSSTFQWGIQCYNYRLHYQEISRCFFFRLFTHQRNSFLVSREKIFPIYNFSESRIPKLVVFEGNCKGEQLDEKQLLINLITQLAQYFPSLIFDLLKGATGTVPLLTLFSSAERRSLYLWSTWLFQKTLFFYKAEVLISRCLPENRDFVKEKLMYTLQW